MKIHEYQARTLFNRYGILTPDGRVVSTAESAVPAAEELGLPVVVKAQVLVGGRGKAGGVKLAESAGDLKKKAGEILDLTIKSIPVEKVLLVPAYNILQEYYVGLTVDRGSKNITLMMSASGGVDIEELAVTDPDKIEKVPIYPHKGLLASGAKEAVERVFKKPVLVEQALKTVEGLYRLFLEKGCSLVEINPYALVDENTLRALDAKINFDDNAVEGLEDIEQMRNAEEYSQDEIVARNAGLSFVSMDGDIGCIVNGAGLAMATMDIIKHHGGEPANFLDVGGSSNPQKVLNALKIILRNPKVKAILINIFGGITRCDDIANGILLAMEQISIEVPMVIRLIGTNDTEGIAILQKAGLKAEQQLSEAVKQVVGASK